MNSGCVFATIGVNKPSQSFPRRGAKIFISPLPVAMRVIMVSEIP